MNPFPTSKENIALDLMLDWLGESRNNRRQDEYESIILRLNTYTIEALHTYVNQRLKEWADAGFAPYQICYFKAGQRYPWYEEFPKSLSRETVRTALLKSGFRRPPEQRRSA